MLRVYQVTTAATYSNGCTFEIDKLQAFRLSMKQHQRIHTIVVILIRDGEAPAFSLDAEDILSHHVMLECSMPGI